MKKSILLISVSIFIVSAVLSSAIAAEQISPLIATASSSYNIGLGPSRTVDGNVGTYWIGGPYGSPWWIRFDTGAVNDVAHINMKWYSAYYVPTDYDIQISTDGTNWETIYENIKGDYDVDGEVKNIERNTRFIRLYIRQILGVFPIFREFEAYTAPSSAVPRFLRFQGRLGDAEGVPLESLPTITFRLYDVETGGIPLWTEVQSNVDIEGGLLDIKLGSVTSLNLPFDKQYWLGVEVGSDGEMIPRFELTTVPYAFTSEN